MYEWHLIQSPTQLQTLQELSGLPLQSQFALTRPHPDAHWVLVDRTTTSEIVGHYSLWWLQTASHPQHKLGYIGHYGVADAIAAQVLLAHACDQLHHQGCTRAIAPIDGNTWNRYRVVSDRGDEPPFFLEPDTSDDWCSQFEAAGFAPCATYQSSRHSDLIPLAPKLDRVASRMNELGVRIYPLAIDRFEAELKRIYQLCCLSFRHNFLYTDLPEVDFLAQYHQLRACIQPNLVLFAERSQQLVGFVFALPDRLQAKRGQAIDTVIIKTVAILPERQYAGLGALLVARCEAIALHLGYRSAIHALMHDANPSRNLGRHTHVIRRYTLFAKDLLI